MRQLFTLFISCLCYVTATAQQPTNTAASVKDPLVMVDSFKTSLKELVLDPQNIASIHVFKDSIALTRFGENAKTGAVLIKTKPNTSLLRLNTLLDKFQVADSLRKYRVCINEIPVGHPELILLDESQISGVTTFYSVDWNPRGAYKDEKLLNIIAKNK